MFIRPFNRVVTKILAKVLLCTIRIVPLIMQIFLAVTRTWSRLKRYLALTLLVLFCAGLCLSLALGSGILTHLVKLAAKSPQNQQPVALQVLRFGHQPFGTPPLLNERGNLDKQLALMGISVKWTEFSAGKLVMQAIAEGKIDIGQAGGVPSLFAQADGVPFVYVASQTSIPRRNAILVHQDSPIQTLADLKGKKIAFTKSSSAHYLMTQALLKAGLTLQDVQPVYLLPPQGQIAFERGEVDAFAVWDPFQALATEKMPVRVLATAQGLAEDMNFYLASRNFAEKHGDIIKIVIEELQQIGMWARQNPDEVTKIIAHRTGMKLSTAKIVNERTAYDPKSIQDRDIEEQQRMANTFFRLGLLTKQIWVEDAIWKEELKN